MALANKAARLPSVVAQGQRFAPEAWKTDREGVKKDSAPG
jgi:hypothetical protein